ncbi:sulfate ABC transporter substrate-binding protein [Malaciobacter marinus]|jgi:sulfate transport system substrate-binding protein|uniref:sulfate ABC transporter substrate-binding protein n=1 Tax=Malaciobacter marinus TaxID=505249 RepID=UPI0009A6E19B|nr:sulfate ABC transporter substrate-binding protein [Malaciobacter marinus]SKB47727.1 sulfate transport system substrate-binding protein [Malaciobacter marinus]
MRNLVKSLKIVATVALLIPALSVASDYDSRAELSKKKVEILNVSYDPTRELYSEYNKVFAKYWKEQTGQEVTIKQSHGGAGKQARAIIDGLKADVITLALAYDIDKISDKTGLFPKDWQSRLENNSAPYTSTIVFLVRKGNPKGIHDWNDLIKPGVEVITPNPKTSGGARWNYLAAYSYALKKGLGTLDNLDKNSAKYKKADKKAKEFISKIYKNVPVLDSGARGSTNTFVQRRIGDVLLAWENEAFLAINELGHTDLEIVVPSISIKAEPPVTVADKQAKRDGVYEVSKAYLEYLYSPKAQNLVAKYYYRPYKPEFANKKDLERFPNLKLITVNQVFGSWKNAQEIHFNDGGVFDSIYRP